MGDKFKLDGDGNCGACNKLSLRGESVQCYTCKGLFHVVCESAQGDDKVATKTTVTSFLQPSTKENFLFFCDRCLTEMEIRNTESETNRVNSLDRCGPKTDRNFDIAECAEFQVRSTRST